MLRAVKLGPLTLLVAAIVALMAGRQHTAAGPSATPHAAVGVVVNPIISKRPPLRRLPAGLVTGCPL